MDTTQMDNERPGNPHRTMHNWNQAQHSWRVLGSPPVFYIHACPQELSIRLKITVQGNSS